MDSFFPYRGVGVGLRPAHMPEFIGKKPQSIDWVEALTENYLRWENGFLPRGAQKLELVRAQVPVALHGVSLSIGSADPVQIGQLKRLKELADRIQPMWISDHLCWTGMDRRNTHDLLPFPYTKDFLKWVVSKIQVVQEYLQRPILMENVSSYVDFDVSEMPEWEFVAEVAKRSGCGLLLDINNIYVSSQNHGFDPFDYLKAIPPGKVGQIHLAGHYRAEDIIIDTHDDFVCKEVWELMEAWTSIHGNYSAMIEWDSKLPEWKILEKEAKKIRKIQSKIYEGANQKSNRELAATVL